MNKVILLILMCMFIFNCNAQDISGTYDKSSRVEPKANMIRVGFGPGIVTSKIVFYNRVYENSIMYSLAADYEHVWDTGFGFGVNLSQNYLSESGNNVFYAGASFVMAHTTDKGWRWETALGLGYATNDFGVEGSKHGVGSLLLLGVTYKISNHWSIGADLRTLVSRYHKPEGWADNYGVRHYNASLGIGYLF